MFGKSKNINMLSFEKASIIVQLCKLQTFTSFKLNVKTKLLTKIKFKLEHVISYLLSVIIYVKRTTEVSI